MKKEKKLNIPLCTRIAEFLRHIELIFKSSWNQNQEEHSSSVTLSMIITGLVRHSFPLLTVSRLLGFGILEQKLWSILQDVTVILQVCPTESPARLCRVVLQTQPKCISPKPRDHKGDVVLQNSQLA